MRTRNRRLIEVRALLAAASLVAILLQPGVANAATITVTTTDDESVMFCTLRDAITAANINNTWGQCSAGSGDDIIDITATGTINLDSSLPAITTNMTIDGPGASMLDVHRQSGGDYRILSVTSTAVATISDLTVSNGHLTGIGQAGAGIGNFGTLTLDRVTVTGNNVVNTSDSQNPAPGGGGIFNGGVGIVTMTLRRSTVTGNTVTSNQTAVSGQTSADATGGGLYNTGTLTVERSTISGNSVSASVTSTDANASAFAAGGAVRNYGVVVVKASTVSGNDATAAATSPAITTTRGAIYTTGNFTATSATIAFNTAESSANLSAQGTETVTSSIISNPGGSPHCDGSVEFDGSFNLVFPGGCAGITPWISADPQLEPLAANGGSTLTHALPGTSPAIDAGTDAGETTDQRELARPVDHPAATNADEGSDIGAFEQQDVTLPTDPSVNSTSHTPNAPSNDPTVDVTWSGASDGGGSGIDGYSFEWTSSPTTLPDQMKDVEESAAGTTSPPLADGSHWFHLRTRDNGGNWTSTAHLGPFLIDTGAPDTIITKQPKKKIVTSRKRVRVKFEFSSADPGATFLCRLDKGPSKPCSSPTSLKVGRGRHVFSMQATDQALNADPTPAVRRFKVVREV